MSTEREEGEGLYANTTAIVLYPMNCMMGPYHSSSPPLAWMLETFQSEGHCRSR
jgi:hypothetical protein